MAKLLRGILIIVVLIFLGLLLGPFFIPSQSLKRTIVETAYEKFNIALSVEAASLSLIPSVSIHLSNIRFSTRKNTLPMEFQMKGSAKDAQVDISVWEWIDTGQIPTQLSLKQPDIQITRIHLTEAEKEKSTPPSSASPSTPTEPSVLDQISLTLQFEDGKIAFLSAPGTATPPLTFRLKSFQAKSPKLSEYLQLQTLFELPKTSTQSGSELSLKARATSSLHWDHPWTESSKLKISSIKVDVTDLSYVSHKHHVKQTAEQPIFVDIKNLELHPDKINEVKTMVVRLNDHVFKPTGHFKLSPLTIEAKIAPFDTSITQFPFQLLQDMFPGAHASIQFPEPLLFSYTAATSEAASQWQFQLNNISLKDIQWPLPWFLLQQPSATLTTRIQYIPASAEGTSNQWKFQQSKVTFPTFELEGSGHYNLNSKQGSLTLNPFRLDLSETATMIANILPATTREGELHIPSTLFFKFKKEGSQWKTTASGRFSLSEVSGTWKEKYQFEKLTGIFLLTENKNALDCTISKITPLPDSSQSTDEENKHTSVLKPQALEIQKVQLKASGTPGKQWVAQDLAFTINNGQVKIQNATWDLGTQMAQLGKVQVFHNDLASFLASFGGDWNETLQGKLRLNTDNLSLPLLATGTPVWSKAKGHLDIEVLNISWIVLPLQGAFNKFFQNYLEKFRVHEVLGHKALTDYEQTLNTSFLKGSFQLDLGDEEVQIKNLSLTSPDSNLTGSGKATNLQSLKELNLILSGTFSYLNPHFLYGPLRKIMLDNSDNLHIPYALSGTLTVPHLEFDQEKIFQIYDQKAKALLIKR